MRTERTHRAWLVFALLAAQIGCQSGADHVARSSDEEAKAGAKWEEREADEAGAYAPAAAEPVLGEGQMALGRGYDSDDKATSRPPTSSAGLAGNKPVEHANTARMIVYNAWLRLAAHQPDALLGQADTLALEHGGYVQSSTLTQRIYRLPSPRYASFMAALQTIGEVRSLRQTSRDVTEEFQNVEARIENLRALRTRYEELLAQAQTMEERLTIERELRRIAQDLRVLEERRRYLADQAAFATVTLDVEPIVEHVVHHRRAQPFEWVSSYGLTGLFG